MIDNDDYRDLQEKCERLEKKAEEYKQRFEDLLKEVEERTKIHDKVHGSMNRQMDWLAEMLETYGFNEEAPKPHDIKFWREAARKFADGRNPWE